MFFDESAVVAAHLPLIRQGDLGDAYRSATLTCCKLIAGCFVYTRFDRREAMLAADIGARMVNSCGAAGSLMLRGYWSPAAHQVRDIVECHQLLEYFRYEPSKALEWAAATGSDRNRRFGFKAVEGKLTKLRGAQEGIRRWFNWWSNTGSHPSIEGLSMLMSDQGKVVGPTANPDRLKFLTGDLWETMTWGTLEYVRTMDALLPDLPPMRKRFRFEVAVIEGAHDLFHGLTPVDIHIGWPT
jgi:hypothetical protein